MSTVRRAMAGGALLPVLPVRLAGLVAGRWLERLHDAGARNAASAIAAGERETALLELGISRLSAARVSAARAS